MRVGQRARRRAGVLAGWITTLSVLLACNPGEVPKVASSLAAEGVQWREGFWLTPDAPDPTACAVDADCVCADLVLPNGCCWHYGSPFPQSQAYAAWLRGEVKRPACQEIQCSPGPLPGHPLPCAFEARCVAGQCANACGAAAVGGPKEIGRQEARGDAYWGVILAAGEPLGGEADAARWTPSAQEVAVAEAGLVAGLAAEAGADAESAAHEVVERLPRYRRYYAGVEREGVRAVWIYLVYEAERISPEWQRELILGRGGGAAFVRAWVAMPEGSLMHWEMNSLR